MEGSDENLLKAIRHYQGNLDKYSASKKNDKLLHSIEKLYKLPIKISHLEETGIGRTVNSLRKLGGDVGDAAKSLVAKWKEMVVEADHNKIEEPQGDPRDSSYSSEEIEPEEKENTYNEKDIESSTSHRSSDRDSDKHRRDREKYSKSNGSDHRSSSSSGKKRRHKSSNSEESSSEEDRKRHKSKKGSHDGSSDEEKEKKHKSKKSKHRDCSEDRKKSKKSKHRDEESTSSKHRESSSKSRSKEKNSSSEQEDSKTKHTPKRGSSSEQESKMKHNKRDSSSDNDDSYSEHEETKSKHKFSREKESKSHSSERKDKKQKESPTEIEETKSKHHKSSRDKDRESKSEKKDRKKEHEPSLDSDETKSKHHKSSKKKDKKEEKEKCKKEDSKDKDKLKESEDNKKDKNKTKSSSSEVREKTKTPKGNTKKPVSSIDCESASSFAEALGMLEPSVSTKSSVKKKSYSTSEKPKLSTNTPCTSSSSYSKEKSEKPLKTEPEVPKLLIEPALEPLDINISSLLPSITPNYRPLGLPVDAQPKRMLTEEEALSKVISTKNQRTKVYSGNKTVYSKVPSLIEMCTRIIQDNIDALEYTGGVPYLILKPIIEKANPDQLFMLEHHNPYLIEDTDELWQLHCQKEFRNKRREELESWREMYMRCLDEREAKLKALTANIKQAQDVKVPVRTTKLAYIDSAVKPPRNIARKQAKNGTAFDKRPVQTPAQRLAQLATSGEAGKIAVPNPGSRVAERNSSSSASALKPKKAPLMAKTLSLLKNRFGRR